MTENNKRAVHLTLSPEDTATLDEVARQFEGNRSMGARFVISEYRRLSEMEAAMSGRLVDTPAAYVAAETAPQK